jgi:hypothetical protein
VCGCSCVGRNHPRHGKPYYYRCSDDQATRGNRAPRGHAPYVQAPWLEETVWSDVRQFLCNPGAVLERIREQRESGAETIELEERKADLTKRLREVERERDRLLELYVTGEIDADWLTSHVRDRENKIANLKVLLAGIEDDLARRHEQTAQAESAASWLVTVASRVEEVEEDTEVALEKRRELIRLLVEKITVGRDETGQPRVHITYRFGPPEPDTSAGDVAVYGDEYGSAFRATSAFCSAAKWASLPSSGCSAAPRRSSESIPTTSSSQEVGTKAVARAYSRALPP